MSFVLLSLKIDYKVINLIVLNKKVTKLEYANLIKYEANLNSAVKQL